MRGSTQGFAAMVDSVDQVVDLQITMDLPGGQYSDVTLAAKRVSVKSETVSDVPDGTRLDVGYTSDEAEFTLAGMVDPTDETKDAAWLFGRYPTPASDGSLSPLNYLDAVMAPVDIAFGLVPDDAQGVPELPPDYFYGFVDQYEENEDGSVDFTCIDQRQLLRGTAELPAVVTAPPYNDSLTFEFVLDYLLRAKTGGLISSWPARRSQCALAVGLRTSLTPEVGSVDLSVDRPGVMFAAGRWGTGMSRGAGTGAAVSIPYDLALRIGTKLFLECAYTPGTGGAVSVSVYAPGIGEGAGLTVQPGQVTLTVRPPQGGPFTPMAGLFTPFTWTHGLTGAVYVGVSFALPAPGARGWSATMWVSDGTTTMTMPTGAQTLSADRQTGSWPTGAINSDGTGCVVEAVQISREAAPTPNTAFVPRAELDPSLNPLQAVPAISGDAWDTIQAGAEAELGVAGFFGRTFRFLNRNTLRTAPVSRTLTSTRALKGLGSVESAAASVVNRAQIGYTGWTFALERTVLWTLQDVRAVNAGDTITIGVDLDDCAFDVQTNVLAAVDGGIVATQSQVRFSADRNGVAAHPGGVVASVQVVSPNKLTVTVHNSSRTRAWIVSPASFTDLPVGTPFLQVSGKVATPNDELTADFQYPAPEDGGAASSRFGEVPYTSTGNPWNQDPAATLLLATDIVLDSYLPQPDLTAVDIVPDVRLRATDKVFIQDTERTGVREYCRIFATELTYEEQDDGTADYTMTVDARTLAMPDGWIGDVAGRSEGGITTRGY